MSLLLEKVDEREEITGGTEKEAEEEGGAVEEFQRGVVVWSS